MHSMNNILFYHGTTAPVGQGLLISEASWSHSDTVQCVGFLWKSDQSDAENFTWQHTTLTTDNHAPDGIRTRNPCKREAADPRFRQRGHWDRQEYFRDKKHNILIGNLKKKSASGGTQT